MDEARQTVPEWQPTAWQGALGQLATVSAAAPHVPSRRLYFFEEALPQGAWNVRHVYTPVTKLGVILDGDAPWEHGAHMMSFCGTILRLDDGRLRLYYTTSDPSRMRLAVADVLAEDATLPLVLDDALVNYDAERRRRALTLLDQIAAERQVILLSHDAYYVEWAAQVHRLGDG